MSIDKSTVDRIAQLSRLQFDENETDAIMKDMNKMLDFIEKLKEVDNNTHNPRADS